MSKFVVTGGRKLKGEIEVEGAKNSVLPILAASVLNQGISVIKNCPRLKDVDIMIRILRELGCKAEMEKDVITIDSSTLHRTDIPEDLAAEMRSSIIFLGPMLARCGKVTISYPGECVIILAQLKSVIIDIKTAEEHLHSSAAQPTLSPSMLYQVYGS